MRLSDLKQFNPITIQCHDNPDPDAIASGFGLYNYFKKEGCDVRLVYSGRNTITKSNLQLMMEKLHIPITYICPQGGGAFEVSGLLITVDCQYGAGNVSGICADTVAIIDHHQVEIDTVPLTAIVPTLGSCSTLVWKMLKEEGVDVNSDVDLATALYYGLYSDTNQLSEIRNPLDMDMRDELKYDNSLLTMFRNCNLSLKELEIAGIAMIRCSFNADYGFAVIKAQPCDPNILGLISDFLLQVDVIKTCVVFNETGDGFKISIRSCVKEVNASELAAYLTEGVGSGGGHYEKAGGFISIKLLHQKHPQLHVEAYLNSRMMEYYESFDIIHAAEYQADLDELKQYRKKKLPVGYVRAEDILPIGTPILVRTMEGDFEMTVDEGLILMIGIKGEVYSSRIEKFERAYEATERAYDPSICVVSNDYIPTIKNRQDGSTLLLTKYAKICIPKGEVFIYVKQLERGVKVFTTWDQERYMLGKAGDYLAVRSDDLQDVYVVERDVFGKTYEEIVHV